LTGLAGGGFAGLTGVGGGALMIPLMTGILKMRQHTAHGTSLVIIVPAAAAAAAIYALGDGIDWRLVAALLGGSLAGAYAGARLVRHIPALHLRRIFALFLVAVAARLLAWHDVDPILDAGGAWEALAGAGVGLVGGITAGALGVGGGAIFVPGLVIVLGIGQHEAQGASLGAIVFTAMVGAFAHARQGTVDMTAARRIVPFAIPAGVLGGLVAGGLEGAVLQRLFAFVILVVGVQMLIRTRSLAGPSAATSSKASVT
jgi:uncharacterized membrane protein YfcA